MITDIFKFIFRTIILNPMAIIGIVLGYFVMQYYGVSNIPTLLKMPIVYGGLFAVALLYALLFKHVYKEDSVKVDWLATIFSSFGHMFNIILAVIFTCAIIFSINYGFPEKLDSYLRYENTQDTPKEGVPINQSSY